jgi:hypothetical protein
VNPVLEFDTDTGTFVVAGPLVAVTIELPGVKAWTKPDEETLATDGDDELQVTFVLSSSFVPSL